MNTVRLRSCRGIDAVRKPFRLWLDLRTGAFDAAEAVNVAVDDTGAVSRRQGFSRLLPGDWHSLWADGGDVLGVWGAALVRVRPDNAVEVLREGLTPGARVAFCRVGAWVFWADGCESGVIEDGGGDEPWGGRTWPYADDDRDMTGPPAGTILEAAFGRIWIATGRHVLFTESGFYHFMDRATGFLAPFDGDVTMLRAVDDGLFVGTERRVWFVAGSDPKQMQYRQPAAARAVMGTDVAVDPATVPGIGRMALEARGVVWTGREGIMFGGPGGQVSNLTKNRVPFPAGSRGAACIFNGRYLAVMEE